MAKKQVGYNLDDVLRDAFRKVKAKEALDIKKPLDIINFSEKLIGEHLSPAQRVIMKFYYAGSRFNENLELDQNDLNIIKKFDIEQSWIFDGDESKLKHHYLFLNKELREAKLKLRQRIMNGESVDETLDPLWFLDLTLVLGRRSGKSYLSSLISSYEAYKLLMLGDPQEFYRINSPISIINTATSADQAVNIIFKEIKRFIQKCPVFDGRIGKNIADEMHILTDKDLEKYKVKEAGKDMEGTIVLKSGSSNSASLRGLAAVVVIYDEMAHFVETNGKGSAKEVYNALSRSSATFKMFGDGRQIVLSSPYQPSGYFYELYCRAKREPTALMFQVPTWNINHMVPRSVLQPEFDADPELANVEYGAQFLRKTSTMFFPPEKIEKALNMKNLTKKTNGVPGLSYYLHIDAADSSDRYAFMIGHSENRYNVDSKQYVKYIVEDYSYFIKPKNGHLDPDAIVDDLILPLFNKFNIICTSFDGMFSAEQQKKIRRKCSTLKEIRFAGRQKNNLYDSARNLFMSERIELCQDDPELEGELKNIQVDHSTSPPRIDKNSDSRDFPNDDLVDCLCGIIGCLEMGVQGLVGLPRIKIARTGAR